MILRQLFDAESSTYTYILGDTTSRNAAIIDPVIDGLDQYIQLLDELELKLVVALDTHTHADHITALGELRDKTHCLSMIGKESQSQCASHTFSDGEFIPLGSINIKAIHTPGHTDDSYSFVIEEEENTVIFTGDTLLIRGTGRTDFQNGSAETQYASLWKKLLCYSDQTTVYPGHDYKGWTKSTIGEEKRHNPRLQLRSAQDYAKVMAGLDLPSPKLMDVAVPANQACGQL